MACIPGCRYFRRAHGTFLPNSPGFNVAETFHRVLTNFISEKESKHPDSGPKEASVVSVKYEPDATLSLTEEEAYALLSMCLLTPMKLDRTAEKALRKLAEFCKHKQYFVQPGGVQEPPK